MKPSHETEKLLAANEQLVLGMLRIQSEVQAAEVTLSEIFRAASVDELTNLPNRRELLTRLADAITGGQRSGGSFALLFLDLNGLKRINDTLGHHVGDAVLMETAQRLSACVSGEDTVARYGGDEFVVLLPHPASREDAQLAVDKIKLQFGQPWSIGDRQMPISISVGISLYPDDGTDSKSLIDIADSKMYRAKQAQQTSTLPSAIPAALMMQMREANGALVLAALNAQALQEQAEATLRQEKFILAMVAHELRAPLAPLSLSTEMLANVNTKDVPRLHAIIGRHIEHLTRLVEDLVDVSRASTGKLRLTLKTIDFSQVIQQAIDVCEPLISAKHQTLQVNACAVTSYIDADQLRLTQVLSNLLGNASKFSPTHGVIALSYSVEGQWARIEVSDDGVGISAHALPMIFEPFIQDEHALSINKKGLGIGLTVVRELVKAHGGNVAAHSNGLGLGSRFTLLLPLSELSDSHHQAPELQ
ncbi:diguanylate cyclase domain-containing protein [Pseudomonas huanghezhanensis]|uniref:diguanylate cyclase domain-containing protein n=1 Tax=Pseudomonas huanghezhanensis TaxID=3002903 RepID=UPI0022860DEC|nr:diguanylate cyclase [Pseudomonas sp. BSw22131]